MISVNDVVASLENSLRQLGTDYVDVFQFHAIPPDIYDQTRDAYAPALLREKEKGKICHLGLTESPPNDPAGVMLKSASEDPLWEVILLGYHMMHQVARRNAFPGTLKNGIGTVLMFVVRSIFSIPGRLEETSADAMRPLPGARFDAWTSASSKTLGSDR